MATGADTMKSELAHVSVEPGTEGNSPLMQKENGELNQELVTNGLSSHGKDEANLPMDAADEWPESKKIHSFYIVKYRAYTDQKMKAKVDLADKELKRLNQVRSQILDKLKAERASRNKVVAQLVPLDEERNQFRQIMDEKFKEREPLQEALSKLRGSNGPRDKNYICSSEEELNDVIKGLEYRIQHESITLNEEKQILKEIKHFEGTRHKVIAKAAMMAEVQEAMGEKEALQDQVKLIGADLDGVRKEQQAVKAKIKQLEAEKQPIQTRITALDEQFKIAADNSNKAYDRLQLARDQSEKVNAPFLENRRLLAKARDLASKNDVVGVKELTDTEVDKFISLWSSSKAFRDDYERRILYGLDSRQLSRDGRMRNPDEKPLVEPPTPPEPEIVAKPKPREDKEKSSKQQKEATNNKAAILESSMEESGVKGKDVKPALEKVEKAPPPKKTEVDEVKLKREEEMAKAKQALERKKKLAEKAAAKAAIKAQKEAEKKLKDREKKAKKKAAASAPEEPPTEAVDDEVAELEKAEVIVQAEVPLKIKERKAKTTVRQRGRAKVNDSLPKVILKRKKSTNYWTYAVPAAALLVLILSVMGYYYLL